MFIYLTENMNKVRSERFSKAPKLTSRVKNVSSKEKFTG